MTYAKNTDVSSERSRMELERTLARYGADQFGYGWDSDRAIVQFRADGRLIRFLLPMPNRDDDYFRYTPSRGYERSPAQQEAAYEQAVRQKWRALNLVVKAKLEAVESELVTFDQEFLAHIVLPDGATAGDFMVPQIAEAYETGRMPSAMPALTSGRR